MSEALPLRITRWLAAAGDQNAATSTAVIEGRARFRQEGKGLWLPIEAVMWH